MLVPGLSCYTKVVTVGVQTALLERESEVVAIEGAIDRARAGNGSLTLVEGPAGIGKSRLLSAATAAAGVTVLRAHGSEAETSFPFGVALQLFERAQGGDLMAGAAGLAAPLFSGAADPRGAFAIVHGLFWLTLNLAERAPTVLVVDDVHWADEPSLRLLRYLAHRLDGVGVAIIAASRSGDPAARRDDVAALLADPHATHVAPGALSRTGTATLVRDYDFIDPDDAFVDACHEVSGGNPYLLRELLRTLSDDGVPPTAEHAAALRGMAPDSVARSVLLRLSRLGPGARDVARATAILGEDARLDRVAALAGIEPALAAATAAELAAADVLTRAAVPAFTHPMTAAAVLGDIAGAEQAHLHGEAARLLSAGGAPNERVAAHLLHAPPVGDEWAGAALRDAARTLAAGGPAVAARALERALAEPQPDDQLSAIWLDLSKARLAAGAADAIDAFERAMELAPDAAARSRAATHLGDALYAQGRIEDSGAAFKRALESAQGHDPVLEREAAARLASLASVLPGGGDEANRYRARIAAGDGPTTSAERRLLAHLAVGAVFASQPHTAVQRLARRALEDGLLIADDGADSPHWNVANTALIWSDDLEAALEACSRALDQARREGTVLGFATACACRSTPYYLTGRLADAAADAEQALAARADGWGVYVGVAGAALALARLERDQVDDADAAIADLGDLDAMPPHFAARPVHARGIVRHAQGRFEEALADQLTAGAMVASPNPGILAWRSSAALAALQAGRRMQALELAREEVELARAYGAPGPLGVALEALGLAEVGATGIALLRESVGVLETSPALLARARALTSLGGALRRGGQRSEARETLLAALDLAGRLEATRTTARIRDELGLLGARPRRTAQSGTESLTPAERRVADLAADGLTNRAIAEALFVTPKTVDWHLRAVFRKLEISSRRDLAAALGR